MREQALVLFSGGQDSTTCLAWALANFERVQTARPLAELIIEHTHTCYLGNRERHEWGPVAANARRANSARTATHAIAPRAQRRNA